MVVVSGAGLLFPPVVCMHIVHVVAHHEEFFLYIDKLLLINISVDICMYSG